MTIHRVSPIVSSFRWLVDQYSTETSTRNCPSPCHGETGETDNALFRCPVQSVFGGAFRRNYDVAQRPPLMTTTNTTSYRLYSDKMTRSIRMSQWEKTGLASRIQWDFRDQIRSCKYHSKPSLLRANPATPCPMPISLPIFTYQ